MFYKRFSISHLIVLLSLSVMFFMSCSKEAAKPASTRSQNHIEYFGFTLVNTYFDDPTDTLVKSNYSDEVYSFSNTADLIALGPTDNILPQLQAMDALQMKGLIHLNELFFEWVGTNAPSGNDYQLRLDYKSRWNDFVSASDLVNSQHLVCAFYLGEEPTWNGISSIELDSAASYIKQGFPSVPIMSIEAYPSVANMTVPASIDWLGWNHYTIADPQNDTAFLNEFAFVKSKKTRPQQRLVLIMDTHFIQQLHGDLSGLTPLTMKDVARSYFTLAQQEEDVVALFGYTWPGGFDTPNMLGARNLPAVVQDEFRSIGKEITGKP